MSHVKSARLIVNIVIVVVIKLLYIFICLFF